MVRMLTASTLEIDDIEYAYSEICRKLDLDNALLKNSVGIIGCHSDFIYSKAAAHIAKNLPFDVVGVTTFAGHSNDIDDQNPLTVSVLTSDDTAFGIAWDEDVEPLQEIPFKAAWDNVMAGRNEPPSFGLVFAPYSISINGEQILGVIDEMTGGIPLFGVVASTSIAAEDVKFTIYNEKISQHGTAVIFGWGDFVPEFHISTIYKNKAQKYKSVITRSEGTILLEVDNLPTLKYLETIGINSSNLLGASIIPFIVDYRDGTEPVTRAIAGFSDDHQVVCGGHMPEGAAISVGFISKEDILEITETLLEKITTQKAPNGLIIVACGSRHMISGMDESGELSFIRNYLNKTKIPYQLMYAMGEMCPVKSDQGVYHNTFHNYAITICAF